VFHNPCIWSVVTLCYLTGDVYFLAVAVLGVSLGDRVASFRSMKFNWEQSVSNRHRKGLFLDDSPALEETRYGSDYGALMTSNVTSFFTGAKDDNYNPEEGFVSQRSTSTAKV
jgi:hypothetical protein